MDWSFWITTAIALFAVIIAWMARREARQSSQTANSLQERLVVYEHYPIISVSIEPDDKKIRIALTNASSKNAALDCEINAVLRISAGAFSVDEEQIKFVCGMLSPQSVKYIYPEEINELVADSIPFLSRYPSEQNHFVIRAVVKCSAPHPNSEKVSGESVGYFSVEEGCLVLKPKVGNSHA